MKAAGSEKQSGKRGTVEVTIRREQAQETGAWLTHDYMPGAPPPLPGENWTERQLAIAHELGAKLGKAARRKRAGDSLKIRFSREQAQWLAAFASPDGGWWVFTIPGTKRDVFLWTQPCPERIRAVTHLFLCAATFRQGRPKPKKREIKQRLAKQNIVGSIDPRWIRRQKKQIREIEEAEANSADVKAESKKLPNSDPAQ